MQLRQELNRKNDEINDAFSVTTYKIEKKQAEVSQMSRMFKAERAALAGEAEELKNDAEQAQMELMMKSNAESALRRETVMLKA